MPAMLTPVAQEEWKTLVPQLAAVGLRRIDGKALAGYCVCYARWLEAEALITKIGLLVAEQIVVGDKVVGQKVRRNPAVSIANDALKIMKSFLVEFGMTPAARSRLRVEEPAAADPFEEYLAARGRKQTEQTSVN